MPQSEKPLVSIIIASYNHGAYVADAIRSVLAQTYEHTQLIVIDDASTDESVKVMEALQKEGSFLILKNEQNVGLQRSLARAMQHVEGEYLGIFASDDMILPNKIELQIAFIQAHNLDGVYASGYILKEDNTRVQMDLERAAQMFEAGTYLNHIYVSDTYGAMFQSGLFKTDAIKAFSYIREKFWSDDWAVTIKLLENYKIGFLNEPVVIYRLHQNNYHKDFWNSFPGRIQVAALLTPPEFRALALSNIFFSQGHYLLADKDRGLARKFFLTAYLMKPTEAMLAYCIELLKIRPKFLRKLALQLLAREVDPDQ